MVLEHLDEGATIGRPAIADTLVTMGLVADRSAAFDYYLSTDGPFYVSHSTVSTLDAIGLIAAAVVNHHDLKLGVILLHQGTNGRHNQRFFVIGRQQNTDPGKGLFGDFG
jgi:hypothetical protein